MARHASSGKGLYLTVIGLVIAAIVSMPFIQVPVVVQSDGIVRPSVERQEARAAESGIVAAMYVVNGAHVDAGDTLLTLEVEGVRARLALLDSLAHAQADDLADLAALLAASDTTFGDATVRSPHRRQQLIEHATVEVDLLALATLARREADRARALLSRGFATAEDVDHYEAEERSAVAAVRAHREQTRTRWSDDYTRITAESRRLDSERSSLLETLSRYAVVAPVTGTVELTTLLSRGSVLQRGETVAIISPNTELIAEAWLTPRDIGLIHAGTPARLMIDAFNYRNWGVVDAVVSDIADDASLESDGPRFRVRSRLTRTELRLPGGHRASIRKGMTFRARFVIAQRSLMQLVIDDIDDWLNPARSAGAPAGAL
jgi:HlyD family secretion protein